MDLWHISNMRMLIILLPRVLFGSRLFIYIYMNTATNVITYARLRLKQNVVTDEGKGRNET